MKTFTFWTKIRTPKNNTETSNNARPVLVQRDYHYEEYGDAYAKS